MKIDILCLTRNHPVMPWLETWRHRQQARHDIALLHGLDQLRGGDLLFLISCMDVISPEFRGLYRNAVVLHASDLPKGRGWSPQIWAVLEGARTITVSAISAAEKVDSGDIWGKKTFDIAPHALYDEINAAFFATELVLMDLVLGMIARGERPTPQPDVEPSYYRRRTPADSEIDPAKSIAEQFDHLRVCDPDRYPAFFRMYGHTYEISLRKVK
jgi:methionyl-tRNA formyltransferase